MSKVTPLILLAMGLFAPLVCAQQAPTLLPFQGRLTDQNGVAVSDGVRLVQFKIFSLPTAGNVVWAGELHRTTVNGGLVNVLLGTRTPLTIDFDQPLYLEITVDINNDNTITAADPPLLPRQVILPAVFAKESANSRALDGYTWSNLLGTTNPGAGIHGNRIQANTITSSQLANRTITSNQIAFQTILGTNIAAATITSNNIAANSISLNNLAQAVTDALCPAGTIVAFGGAVEPPGWLFCDGRAISSIQYPRLYAAISTNWGFGFTGLPGSTNNFNLPDLRGLFLRGVNGNRADGFEDPEANSRTNLVGTVNTTGNRRTGNFGNRVGSVQTNSFESHAHPYLDFHMISAPYPPLPPPTATALSLESPTSRTTFAVGGAETRPNNAYVHYIIKY